MAIPAISGALVLELLSLLKGSESSITIPIGHYVIGFISAFITGYFSLSFLNKLATKGNFSIFTWYCFILGIVTLVSINFMNLNLS